MKINTRGVKKTDLCKKKRDFGLEISSPDTPEFKRTRVTRKACLMFKNGKTLEEVMEYIDEAMKDIPYYSETTRDLQSKEVKDLVTKYYTADSRKSLSCKRKDFFFSGKAVYAEPDFFYEDKITVFYNGEEVEVPLIEVGHFTTGMGNFSSREGVGKETSCIFHTLDSLGLLLWGKDALKGRAGVVKVVFDSLKTPKDTKGDYSRPWSTAEQDTKGVKSSDNRVYFHTMFSDCGEIVEGWDLNPKNLHYGKSTKLWENFKNTLEWYTNGVEKCKKTDCEACEFYNICNYSFPPQKKQEKEKDSSVKTIELTKEQLKVVNYTNGICIVDAGAGSGKSQSVALRIVKLLETGTKPENILLLSFSNSAVKVLKERVCKMVEGFDLEVDPKKIRIQSFNSIGDDIIKEKYLDLGFSAKPQLIDDIESYDLVLKAIDWENPISAFDYKNPNMDLKYTKGVGKVLFRAFTYIRENNISKESFMKAHKKALDYALTNEELEKVWETYSRYASLLKEHNYIDFSDQSFLVEKLMEEDELLLAELFPVEHIVVDEFQDSNDYQMILLRHLMLSSNFKSLMVVGDDGQAIYGFRGTSPDNMLHFEEYIGEKVDDLYLSVNHRSLAPIVQVGEDTLRLSSGCIVKNMTSSREEIGARPTLYSFKKADEEIEFVANKIKELIDKGEKPEDIMVISHNKRYLKDIEKALALSSIASQYDMKEDMLSNSKVLSAIGLASFIIEGDSKGLLEYLNEINNNTFVEKTDKQKILEAKMEEIRVNWDNTESSSERREYLISLLNQIPSEEDAVFEAFLEKIIGKSGYTGDNLARYMLKFKLYSSTEGAEKRGEYEAVSLSTAHSSKGKEKKYVFGTLSDFDNTNICLDDFPEIWRLVYVMCTRARDVLTLTSVKYRGKDEETYLPNRIYETMSGLLSIDIVA